MRNSSMARFPPPYLHRGPRAIGARSAALCLVHASAALPGPLRPSTGNERSLQAILAPLPEATLLTVANIYALDVAISIKYKRQ